MERLHRHIEDGREISILESLGDGSRLYFEGAILYTHVDAEGRNLLDYVAAMERALAGADEVLVLGTAGGALATQLCRRGAAVTAVDNMAATFDLARRWFHMPDQVRCVHSDALAFLRDTTDRWDAIAIDVFLGADIPRSMLQSDIGALLARALKPGGLVVWNVADSSRSWAVHWIARALRQAGFSPRRIPVLDEDVGNTLVVGGAAPLA